MPWLSRWCGGPGGRQDLGLRATWLTQQICRSSFVGAELPQLVDDEFFYTRGPRSLRVMAMYTVMDLAPSGCPKSAIAAPNLMCAPLALVSGSTRPDRVKYLSAVTLSVHRAPKEIALPSGMPKVEPLNANEELFWRALMRIILTLPRHLDRDMVQAVGMTANEYTTVMNLSEAPNREMRMADLANTTGLSASRITRLVDDLVTRGFVIKRTSPVDGRGNVAKLTPKGMAKLKSAWPAHLASVRDRVFDQLDPAAVADAAVALDALATTVAARNANPSGRP